LFQFMVCSRLLVQPDREKTPMKWPLLAASAVIGAALWLPAQAAQPGAPAGNYGLDCTSRIAYLLNQGE
jgi:hypothetical protein